MHGMNKLSRNWWYHPAPELLLAWSVLRRLGKSFPLLHEVSVVGIGRDCATTCVSFHEWWDFRTRHMRTWSQNATITLFRLFAQTIDDAWSLEVGVNSICQKENLGIFRHDAVNRLRLLIKILRHALRWLVNCKTPVFFYGEGRSSPLWSIQKYLDVWELRGVAEWCPAREMNINSIRVSARVFYDGSERVETPPCIPHSIPRL